MTYYKVMTLGDLRNITSLLSDDLPLYLDDENDCMGILSITKKVLDIYEIEPDETESTIPKKVTAIVLGVT